MDDITDTPKTNIDKNAEFLAKCLIFDSYAWLLIFVPVLLAMGDAPATVAWVLFTLIGFLMLGLRVHMAVMLDQGGKNLVDAIFHMRPELRTMVSQKNMWYLITVNFLMFLLAFYSSWFGLLVFFIAVYLANVTVFSLLSKGTSGQSLTVSEA